MALILVADDEEGFGLAARKVRSHCIEFCGGESLALRRSRLPQFTRLIGGGRSQSDGEKGKSCAERALTASL